MRLNLRGGALCLDFVNTVDPRVGSNAVDHLSSPAAVAEWGVHVGAVDRLVRVDAVGYRRALALRRTLDLIFAAVTEGRPPAERALLALRDAHVQSLRRARPLAGGGVYRWAAPSGVDAVLLPVIQSALELLGSPALAHVKQCPGDDCGWLFLDTTKNTSRRWCSMASCGAKVKMRRYRSRRERIRRAPRPRVT
jgi:predicted RNA-binding Zn ribbon-like protein